MLSHHNVISNLEAIGQILGAAPEDRVMGVLPFFHAFGFTGTLFMPLVLGLGAVYYPNPLDAKSIGGLIKKYKATLLISTPTFCQAYYRTCARKIWPASAHIVVGAERLRPEFGAQFKEKFGIQLLEGYGATEMGPVVAVNVPDVLEGPDRQIGTKAGTVGHPVPGVAAKVVDAETGEAKQEGEEGLLLLRGPGRMVGYLADPDRTAQVLRDEWYVTGDIALIDEDGFIKITDRLSRFSKVGGEMVPHLKIEEAMLRIPGIGAAAVVAVPDADRGETPVRPLCRRRSHGSGIGVEGAFGQRPAEALDPEAEGFAAHRRIADLGHRQARHAAVEADGAQPRGGRLELFGGQARRLVALQIGVRIVHQCLLPGAHPRANPADGGSGCDSSRKLGCFAVEEAAHG